MSRRKGRPKAVDSPVWECETCLAQFFGGRRCAVHNPTPEQRDAHPERYPRGRFAESIKTLANRDNNAPE